MRLSIVASATLALSVSASSLFGRQTENLPACVSTCFTKVGNEGCSAVDFACLCGNSAFVSGLAQCVYTDCPAADVQSAIDNATQLCTAAGVSVTVPQPSGSGAPSGSSPGPSGSGAGSGSKSAPAPTQTGSNPPAPSQSGTGNGAMKNGLHAVTGVIAAGVIAVLV